MQYIAVAAQPHQAGSIIKVGFMAGTNPDPVTGDMLTTGELYMQPHEWVAMRTILHAALNNARTGVGIEILDGTVRPGKSDNVVEFFRNWK